MKSQSIILNQTLRHLEMHCMQMLNSVNFLAIGKILEAMGPHDCFLPFDRQPVETVKMIDIIVMWRLRQPQLGQTTEEGR